MSDNQDYLRIWIKEALGRKPHDVLRTRAALARALGLTSTKITRMINLDPTKETRRIGIAELRGIEEFFGEKAPAGGERQPPSVAEAPTPFRATTLQAFRQALNQLDQNERNFVLGCGKALAEKLSGYRLVPK
jgi:hypothetical protein